MANSTGIPGLDQWLDNNVNGDGTQSQNVMPPAQAMTLQQLIGGTAQAAGQGLQGLGNMINPPAQAATSPQPQQATMNPSDSVAGEELEKAYRDKANDMYQQMGIQNLAQLYDQHVERTTGAPTGQPAPVSGNPNSATASPTSTNQQGTPSVEQNIWRNLFSTNNQYGQPGAAWQLLNIASGRGFVAPQETTYGAAKTLQELVGQKPIQPEQIAQIKGGIYGKQIESMDAQLKTEADIRDAKLKEKDQLITSHGILTATGGARFRQLSQEINDSENRMIGLSQKKSEMLGNPPQLKTEPLGGAKANPGITQAQWDEAKKKGATHYDDQTGTFLKPV